MKSLIRLRRIALQHGLPRSSPQIRTASTSSSLYPNNPSTHPPTTDFLPETSAFASSSSSHSPSGSSPSLVDRSLRQLPRHISSDASSSPGTDGFFTPSPRPSSSFAPTALLSSLPASELRINGDEVVKRLRDIVQQPKASRTDSVAKQNWHFYRSLPLTTRRSLPADVLQRMLRAVVPAEQGLPSISAVRSLPPGTQGEFNRAFKQKWQRRLQTVMSDMIHSSSTVEAHGATMELPTLKDFSFVLGRLGRVGMWRHCEAISRELEARGMVMDEQVMAKRVWAMARALEIPRSRYSSEPDGRPIADALWGVLAQIEKSDIQTSPLLVNNIIITVGLLQRHFSGLRRRPDGSGDDSFKARLDDLMDEVLTKMCGVDLQYFTLAPPSISASTSTTSGVGRSQLSSHALRAVLYHALRTGGVYRMLSAFETLVERSPQQEQADGEGRHGSTAVDQEEDRESWPTLSEMEAMEREERQSRNIFGRVKAQEVTRDASTPAASAAAGQIDMTTSPSPAVGETFGDDAGAAEARTFNHFLPPLQPPLATSTSSASAPAPAPAPIHDVHSPPESYRILEKGAIQSLILAACEARNLPLALHILRSAMRITAEIRHAWLGRLLARANHPDASPLPTSAESFTPLQDPPPRLGLEAEWFARVHTLTNKVWPHGRTSDKNVLLPRFWSILEDAARQIKDEQAILQSLSSRALTSNTSNTSSVPTSDISAADPITATETEPSSDHQITSLANIFDLSSITASLDSTLNSIEQIRSTSIARRQREVINRQRRTEAWWIRRGERLRSIAAEKAASASAVVDRRAARRRTVKVEGVEEATRPAILRGPESVENERTPLWSAKGEVEPIRVNANGY